MSHTARESLPPLTATRIRSSGAEHVEVLDRLGHLSAAELLEVLRAEVGVVAREVDDRRCLADPALAADGRRVTIGTAGDHGSDLDHVVVAELGVAGHEGSVADHEVRLTTQLQLVEESVDRCACRRVRSRAAGCAAVPSRSSLGGADAAHALGPQPVELGSPLATAQIESRLADRDRDEATGAYPFVGRVVRVASAKTCLLTSRTIKAATDCPPERIAEHETLPHGPSPQIVALADQEHRDRPDQRIGVHQPTLDHEATKHDLGRSAYGSSDIRPGESRRRRCGACRNDDRAGRR